MRCIPNPALLVSKAVAMVFFAGLTLGTMTADTARLIRTGSDSRNDTPYAEDSEMPLPSALLVEDSYLVTAEVHYLHIPLIGYVLTGSFDLSDQFFLRPRRGSEVHRIDG